jgi:hypothetical protein
MPIEQQLASLTNYLGISVFVLIFAYLFLTADDKTVKND